MGDSGEGLVDADARMQERMEERQRERDERRRSAEPPPQSQREIESLKLARLDLTRQLAASAHAGRRAALEAAIADVDARLAALATVPPLS